jgi:hypothetical protein
MKFLCECGHVIRDQTDNLPYKAHSYPDQSMEALYAAIDRLMKSPAPSDLLQRDERMRAIVFPKGGRIMYQCPDCGRLYIADKGKLHCFKSEFGDAPKTLFQAKPPPGDAT